MGRSSGPGASAARRYDPGRFVAWCRLPSLVGLLLALALGLGACGVSFGTSTPSAASNGQGITVPVKVVKGPNGATEVLLPVTIDGQGPFTFLLDTGASSSVIDTPVAQRLGLPVTGSPTPVTGIASQSTETPVQVKSWHIGKINLPSMSVGSLALFGSQRGQGLQGLIGSDIWSMFGSITINYSGQTLIVPKQITGNTGAIRIGMSFATVAPIERARPWHRAA